VTLGMFISALIFLIVYAVAWYRIGAYVTIRRENEFLEVVLKQLKEAYNREPNP